MKTALITAAIWTLGEGAIHPTKRTYLEKNGINMAEMYENHKA